MTYLNDKAKKYVDPLARELEASILMPLDVRTPGQMEAVFERIAKDWGSLDFVVHSIAFSPKEALQGRVVDVPRDGFLTTMDVSCWTFIRMAHLAEPLMSKGGTLFTMTYYGSQMVVKNYNVMGVAKAALECAVRYLAAELGPKGIRVHAISPGPLATRAASGIPEFDELLDKAKAKAPARSLVSIEDVGAATAFPRTTRPALSPAKRCTSTVAITSSTRHGLEGQQCRAPPCFSAPLRRRLASLCSASGSDKAYVGVMAQEVQAVMPGAVTRGGDGYLRVHYDRLEVKFLTYKDWLAAGAQIPTRAGM